MILWKPNSEFFGSANFISPPACPAQRLFQEPPAKSKFLAVRQNTAFKTFFKHPHHAIALEHTEDEHLARCAAPPGGCPVFSASASTQHGLIALDSALKRSRQLFVNRHHRTNLTVKWLGCATRTRHSETSALSRNTQHEKLQQPLLVALTQSASVPHASPNINPLAVAALELAITQQPRPMMAASRTTSPLFRRPKTLQI